MAVGVVAMACTGGRRTDATITVWGRVVDVDVWPARIVVDDVGYMTDSTGYFTVINVRTPYRLAAYTPACGVVAYEGVTRPDPTVHACPSSAGPIREARFSGTGVPSNTNASMAAIAEFPENALPYQPLTSALHGDLFGTMSEWIGPSPTSATVWAARMVVGSDGDNHTVVKAYLDVGSAQVPSVADGELVTGLTIALHPATSHTFTYVVHPPPGYQVVHTQGYQGWHHSLVGYLNYTHSGTATLPSLDEPGAETYLEFDARQTSTAGVFGASVFGVKAIPPTSGTYDFSVPPGLLLYSPEPGSALSTDSVFSVISELGTAGAAYIVQVSSPQLVIVVHSDSPVGMILPPLARFGTGVALGSGSYTVTVQGDQPGPTVNELLDPTAPPAHAAAWVTAYNAYPFAVP